jgi:hypothetical protein
LNVDLLTTTVFYRQQSSKWSSYAPVSDSLHRFSKCDLMMCYHWGLGVCHFYMHQITAATTDHVQALQVPKDAQVPDSEQGELPDGSDNTAYAYAQEGDSNVYNKYTTRLILVSAYEASLQ